MKPSPDFLSVWDNHPCHYGYKPCKNDWRAMELEKVLPPVEIILEAQEVMKGTLIWQSGRVPRLDRWLRSAFEAGRWMEKPAQAQPAQQTDEFGWQARPDSGEYANVARFRR